MNKLIFSACVGFLALGVVLSAQAFTITNTGSMPTGTLSSGVVTSADLGVTEVGTLPTNHFYFFKELGRGVKAMFTWDSVASAELALKISNEKAAELIEVEKADPKDTAGIQEAIENYTRSSEKLSTRLSQLKDNSQNPNVAALLEKIDEQTTKHLIALSQVSERLHLTATATMSDGTNENVAKPPVGKDDDCDSDCAGIDAAIKEAETKIGVTLVATTEKDANMKQKAADQIARAEAAIKDTELRMKAGLETAGGMLGNGASVVGGLVPGGAIISAKSATLVVTGNPGGSVSKSGTLNVSATPGGTVQGKMGISPKVDIGSSTEATDHAINTKGTGTAGKTVPSADAQAIIAAFLSKKGYDYYRTATDKILSAKEAFANENYGEAFGQARAAEVIAVEAARMSVNMTIERQTPKRDFGDRAPASNTPTIKQTDEKDGASIHSTTETGVKKDVIKVSPPLLPRSIPENSIEVIPAPSPAPMTTPETEKSGVCSADYNPVCGTDGKTYSNTCQANTSKVSISYTGECKVSGSTSGGIAPALSM